MENLQQLKTLILSIAWDKIAVESESNSRIRYNVQSLESVGKKSIDAARLESASFVSTHASTKSTTVAACSPLYHGSKICFACSNLHHSQLVTLMKQSSSVKR